MPEPRPRRPVSDVVTCLLALLILLPPLIASARPAAFSDRVTLAQTTLTPAPTATPQPAPTPAPEPAIAAESTPEPAAALLPRGDEAALTVSTYVLNISTRRFHEPDCRSVGAMKEANRREFTGAREELIEQGYVPCGSCKP